MTQGFGFRITVEFTTLSFCKLLVGEIQIRNNLVRGCIENLKKFQSHISVLPHRKLPVALP